MKRPADVETVCAGRGCEASDLVPGAPVPVCARHLRKLYEFAQSMVEAAGAAGGES